MDRSRDNELSDLGDPNELGDLGNLTDDDFVLGPPSEHIELQYAETGWKALPRYLGVAAFLGILIFWIWAFNNRDSIAHPDEFNDPVFVQEAEAVCAVSQAEIAKLPLAPAANGPVERGLLLEQGTAELRVMVAALNRLELPSDPEAAAGVSQWLGDYDLYLSDRAAYAIVLSEGLDEPFLLSGNANGDRVTDALSTFAEVNQMFSCAPSLDA